ncbi:MAG: hypothetical protein Q9173_000582 [Seirophora scorigena]
MAKYHPSFAKVEKQYEILLDRAVQMFQDSKYHDTGSKRLIEESLKRRKIRTAAGAEDWTCGRLWRRGAACTCVVTEFGYVWPSQTSAFKAEVVLFDREKVKTILEGHLQDYTVGRFEEKDNLDVDASEDMRNPSNTAIDIFQALFANHQEFQDEADVHLYLGATQHSVDTILPQLIRWTEDLVSESGATDRWIHKSAQTASSLGDLVNEESKSASMSVWAQLGTEKLTEIATMNWQTHRAWCQRHGNHSNSKFLSWNWNADFPEPVLNDMQSPWERFDETCEALSETCLAELMRLVARIHKELSAIQMIFTLSKHWTPPIGNVALSSEEGMRQRLPGNRRHRRSVAILYDTMVLGKPFAGMMPGLKAMFESDLDGCIKKLVAKVQIVFDMILSDFDSVFAVTERPKAERSELRNSIKDFIHKAEAIVKGPMKEELARAIKESD